MTESVQHGRRHYIRSAARIIIFALAIGFATAPRKGVESAGDYFIISSALSYDLVTEALDSPWAWTKHVNGLFSLVPIFVLVCTLFSFLPSSEPGEKNNTINSIFVTIFGWQVSYNIMDELINWTVVPIVIAEAVRLLEGVFRSRRKQEPLPARRFRLPWDKTVTIKYGKSESAPHETAATIGKEGDVHDIGTLATNPESP